LSTQTIVPEPAPELHPLRVASWNIQSCRRGLPGVLARLQKLDADLVALQEVDRFTERSGGVDQAALLAREAGFEHHAFFRALEFPKGQYGVALLSRHPLSGVTSEPLPTPPGIEPRVLGRAVLEGPFGGVNVAVTHLSHRLDRAAVRREQARVVAERLSGREATLVLGDFNDLSHSAMYRQLRARFVDVFEAAGEGPGGTHHLGWLLPTVRIDYLFATADLAPHHARVLRTDASDHHILFAELMVPAAAARVAAIA
jgi:endonuclease/exonuclease/phosphatase family metal-dependent hydrolase